MPKRDTDALLEEIRTRYDYATAAWQKIRDEGRRDMRCVAGDVWDEKDRAAREKAMRPCLSLDELSQYTNQLINEVRANKRAIKVSPESQGANEQTAQFRAALIRDIEYRSRAQNAYTQAFENAVHRGYGFLRVTAKYVSDDSFDQELTIEGLPNPDLVTPDPDHLRPDGSDMKYCFVEEFIDKAEFQRTHPDANIAEFGTLESSYPAWFRGTKIKRAEYWVVTTRRRRLLLLTPPPEAQMRGGLRSPQQGMQPAPSSEPIPVFADELLEPGQKEKDLVLPRGFTVARERDVDAKAVKSYLTNGVEILNETDWPGRYIPIITCYGKVLWVDTGGGVERTLLSLIRLARDPAMLYAYYRTCEAELVGMTPKTPFVGYVGQFRTRGADWARVNNEPLAYLEADPTTDDTGQTVLPLPQRQPYAPPIEALEVGAESARRAIQAAIGQSPLPTAAIRRNEKSGVALKQIENMAQKGNYHFIDHYDDMLMATGRVLDDLIPHHYDTKRMVGTRKPDDSAEVVTINDPNDPESPQTDKGRHEVTVSTGPSFDSEREAASDFADTLVGSPQLAQVIGPERMSALVAMAIKLKNVGPLGDEMYDIVAPPALKAQKTKTGQADPAAMAQELTQMRQQLQQAGQMLQAAQQEIEAGTAKERIKAEAAEKLQITLKQMDNACRIRVAEIAAGVKLEDGATSAQTEELALAVEVSENEKDRQHEAAMAEREHAHTMQEGAAAFEQGMVEGDVEHGREVEMAERGHAQALEQGEQSHQQKLQQGAQGIKGQLQVAKAKPQPKPAGGKQ